MNKKINPTEVFLFDESIKSLVYIKNGKLFISNVIDPNFIPFFKELIHD